MAHARVHAHMHAHRRTRARTLTTRAHMTLAREHMRAHAHLMAGRAGLLAAFVPLLHPRPRQGIARPPACARRTHTHTFQFSYPRPAPTPLPPHTQSGGRRGMCAIACASICVRVRVRVCSRMRECVCTCERPCVRAYVREASVGACVHVYMRARLWISLATSQLGTGMERGVWGGGEEAGDECIFR